MYASILKPGRVLAATAAIALMISAAPATAKFETAEAKAEASEAAMIARLDMEAVFGPKELKPGQYLWRKGSFSGEPRVVVGLTDQMAYLYRGEDLVAVAAISSGTDDHPTPKGIFEVRLKKPMHRSVKYDNAPMPFMQMFDQYGTALHAGHNPGYPASHGCVRLPLKFAEKLYGLTKIGTKVIIEG